MGFRASWLPLALVLSAACGGEKSGDASGPVATTTDSAGVQIIEYPAATWDQAPAWQLSAAPLATIGGSADDSIDLTNSSLGAALSDGRVVVVTAAPVSIMLFDTAGKLVRQVGRAGGGPGEYQLIAQLLKLGGDTLLAFDWARRLGLLYNAAGDYLGQLDFPAAGSVPPVMRGRLDDGTYVFALEAFADTSIRSRPHIYREEMPVLETKAGGSRFDTAFTTLGTEMTPQFITVMGQTLPRAQPVAYGASTQIAPRGGTVYVSTGERFEITSYDTAGRVTRMLRVGVARRAVEESDREKYRSRLREVLDLQMKNARFPPGFPQSEIQKLRDQGMRIIDSTVFAERVAAITQLIVEPNGTLWASLGAGLADTTRQWLVFSGDGKLLGKVTTPGLALFAVLDDRIVVRQEDPETGVVRLEVWGLRRTPAPTLR